jgi:hypothetical protein
MNLKFSRPNKDFVHDTNTHIGTHNDQGTHETKFKPECGFFDIQVVNVYQRNSLRMPTTSYNNPFQKVVAHKNQKGH